MSGIFSAIDISASGLSLQRKKMNAVAQNIANAETTRTEDGTPYRRKRIVASAEDENVPFRTAMAAARTKLSRTDPAHRPSSIRHSLSAVEISKADGREIEAPADSFRLVHDPDHPDADQEGYVRMPDIEIITEMVDMIAASRAYEANTMAIASAKEMAQNALEI